MDQQISTTIAAVAQPATLDSPGFRALRVCHIFRRAPHRLAMKQHSVWQLRCTVRACRVVFSIFHLHFNRSSVASHGDCPVVIVGAAFLSKPRLFPPLVHPLCSIPHLLRSLCTPRARTSQICGVAW